MEPGEDIVTEGSLSDGGLNNPSTNGGSPSILQSLFQLAGQGLSTYGQVATAQQQTQQVVASDNNTLRNVIIIGVGLVIIIAVMSAIKKE